MKEAVLVIIKPDGISKKLVGSVISRFERSSMDIIAMKAKRTSKELIEAHYHHIKGQSFFEGVVSYFLGKLHKENKLILTVFYGKDAIKKCRKIAGETNPEDADPDSIRGSYGRITTEGVFENVVHVSSTKYDSEREIKLWFEPGDVVIDLYPTKTKKVSGHKVRMWK